jgi:hypothetical protein
MSMTAAERDVFVADVHVDIRSIARDGKGPLARPVRRP